MGIRVLRVVSNLGIGGVQRQLLCLLKYLDFNRVSTDILAIRRSGELEEEFSRYCTVKVLGLKGKYNPLDIYRLTREITKGGYQVVHVHRTEDIVFMTVLASLLAGVNAIVIHHHFPYKWMSKRKLLLEKVATQRAKRLIGVSQFVARHTVKSMKIEMCKCSVIYNGIALNDSFSSARANKVGLVARLVNFKRIGDFIDASQIVQEAKRDVKILVVGDGEEETRKGLEGRAQEKGIKVAWLGQMKDPRKFMEQLKIGVLSSSKEGLPNVVLEYMVSGALVVATKIPPVEEIVIENRVGYLVSPKNPYALARAILKGLDNCAHRKEIVILASKRMAQFSIEETAQKTMELYENLVGVRS